MLVLALAATLFATPVTSEVQPERPAPFVSEGVTFPALLTLPRQSKGKMPIVVLVAGSGPQDENESIGPNQPFRDIAQGLAAHGIATLRYPKRTAIAPATFTGEHATLDWEVTKDAVAALAFASTLKEVNPTQVYLLGHSLGGTMAPAIARERLLIAPKSVAGLILLAPGVLPIDRTLTRQVIEKNKAAGADEMQLMQVEGALAIMFDKIKDPATPPDNESGLGGQTTIRYWRSWLAVDPAADLQKLNLPSLIVRGEKDIQVSHDDYAAIIPSQHGTRSRHYELANIDHIGLFVQGESTGKEYMRPAHVEPELITLIANWILAH